MGMTYEQAQKRIALEAENKADRDILYNTTSLSESERVAIGEKMVERTRAILAIREAADPTPPLFPQPTGNQAITPEQAREKAHSIRSNPAFWSPTKIDPVSRKPALDAAAHAAMVSELLGLDQRASEG